ncbi:MAG: hypothetical protein IKF37_01015 [Bacilli bacterium]|nr:hypothetical protein [Bacilli bacterium]
MKKILKNRKIQIAFAVAVIVLLVLLCIFNRVDDNMITRVSKVLWAKYYNVECLNDECKYVVAYKGDKKKKSTVKIINLNGKTVVKYSINANDELRKVPVAAKENYAILALKDDKDYTHGYVVINSRGKEVIKEENETLFTLTDKLFYSKKDDLYSIYDYKGNILYKDVKKLEFYNDNKILTFVSNELNIINDKSERILDDYEIVEEVRDDKPLYLIVKDKDGSYYYFNANINSIVGDSFNYYNVMSDKKMLVTRKNNNEYKKYVINTDGTVEKELPSKLEITEKVKDKYEVMEDSVISYTQKGVLVKNISDNSFGMYDLKSGKYSKLFEFNDNELKKVNIYNLYEDLESAYLEVGCSKTYCNEETIVVYNPFNNSVSFKVSNNEKEIRKYREYDNGYKVVTYSDNTYSLFNKDGEELLNSANNIVVLGGKVVIDDNSSKSNVILYSPKKNEFVNDDNSLALLNKLSDHIIYRYFDEKNIYIYSDEDKLLKTIPISESNITLGDKYISYLSKNKVNVYSLINNTEISIDINNGESIEDTSGTIIPSNKGMIVITNAENKTVKILNFKKKTVKNIKNAVVESVNFDEENNKAFLILKDGKNYRLYIIK